MDTPDPPAGEESAEEREQRLAKLVRVARRTDTGPKLLSAVRAVRELLPGDSELGDPLSTAGSEPSDLIARRVSESAAGRPSVSRELGLGALQVWQALAEAQGRGRGHDELAILFTDLVDFSDWAIEAGDEHTLELLRQVGWAVEKPIRERGGQVVKRLGDGLMAVFDDAHAGLDAALEACRNVAGLEVAGYRPALRTGLHLGRPRKLGGDYLGVDVNIAARVCEAASGGEVLVSEALRGRLESEGIELKKRRGFRAKGTPKDLAVYSVTSR